MEELSQIRRELFKLNKERWGLIESIMNPGKLLTASFYERYIKCGSPSCKCASGELHGPFPWIYQNRKGGKLISTSCLSERVKDAHLFSENFKSFKENWSQIKKIDEDIDGLIAKIGLLNEVDAKEFVKKEGEKRGRKQKKSEKSADEKRN